MSSVSLVRQSMSLRISTRSPAPPAARRMRWVKVEPAAWRTTSSATRAGPSSTTRSDGGATDHLARRGGDRVVLDLPRRPAQRPVVDELERERRREQLAAEPSCRTPRRRRRRRRGGRGSARSRARRGRPSARRPARARARGAPRTWRTRAARRGRRRRRGRCRRVPSPPAPARSRPSGAVTRTARGAPPGKRTSASTTSSRVMASGL